MCERCRPGWFGIEDPRSGLKQCEPCGPNTLMPLSGQTECVPCPDNGVDCAVQDQIEVLEGWYLGTNGTARTPKGATTYAIAVTAAGSLEAFDSVAFAARMRARLQCIEPACRVALRLEPGSVLIEANVTDAMAASAAAAAGLTRLDSEQLSEALGIEVTGAATVRGDLAVMLTAEGLAPTRCPHRDNCEGGPDSRCAAGHTGSLCGVCEDGFHLRNGECDTCSGAAAPSLTLYACSIAAVLGFAFLYMFLQLRHSVNSARRALESEERRSQRRSAAEGAASPSRDDEPGGAASTPEPSSVSTSHKEMVESRGQSCYKWVGMLLLQLARRLKSAGTLTKVMLGYFQVMNAFSQLTTVRWPDMFRRFLEALSMFSFDVFSASPLGCLFTVEITPLVEMMTMLLLPVVAAAATLLVAWLAGLCTQPRGARGLKAAALQTETCELLLWALLVLYPSCSKMMLMPFHCIEVEGRSLLRDNPAYACDGDGWKLLATLGVIGTVLYPIGILLVLLWLTFSATRAQARVKARRANEGLGGVADSGKDRKADARSIARARLLVRSYTDEYWFWESVDLLRKFLLTAVVPIVAPDSQVQIYVGLLISTSFGFLAIGCRPYADTLCSRAQTFALVSITITYATGMLLFDDGSGGSPFASAETERRWGLALVVLNAAVYVLLVGGLYHALSSAVKDVDGAVHSRRTGKLMTLTELKPGEAFHLFVSHVWKTGQDQARVIKTRLSQLVPNIRIFLDVDNLDDVGKLEAYISSTSLVLIFLSVGYLESKNCRRELRAAIQQRKRIVVVRETEAEKGKLTDTAARDACLDEPSLLDPLLRSPQVDWFRVSAFQDVTLLQILKHLVGKAEEAPHLFIPGSPLETLRETALAPPAIGATAHLYVSRCNPGAFEMAQELATVFDAVSSEHPRRGSGRRSIRSIVQRRSSQKKGGVGQALVVTQDAKQLKTAGAMLLLLDGATWTADEKDKAALARKAWLADEVELAIAMGIRVVMAHECDVHAKTAVPFATFFDDEQTPKNLIARGLYRDIAVAMQGGEHRDMSRAILALNVVNAVAAPHEPKPSLLAERRARKPQMLAQPDAAASVNEVLLPQHATLTGGPTQGQRDSLGAALDAFLVSVPGAVCNRPGTGSDESGSSARGSTMQLDRNCTASVPMAARLPSAEPPGIGTRVDHPEHGPGTVLEHMGDGRTRIAFDNGEEHRYKPASLHKILGKRKVEQPSSSSGKGTPTPGLQKISNSEKMSKSVRDLQASLNAANTAGAAPKSDEALMQERAQKLRERKASITAGDGTLWEEPEVKSAPGREFSRGPRKTEKSRGRSTASSSGEDVEMGHAVHGSIVESDGTDRELSQRRRGNSADSEASSAVGSLQPEPDQATVQRV